MRAGMHINDLPNEILTTILGLAAKQNERDGVRFTFGISQPPGPPGAFYAKKPARYVKGAVPPPLLKMDATMAMRSVCKSWHHWGLAYALRDLYVKAWRGSERWFELTLQRSKYPLYEMIENFKGEKVYRDPYASLRQTRALVQTQPDAAASIRRLFFDGLYIPETNAMILSTITSCNNLQSISIPWTVLRQSTAGEWMQLLSTNSEQPLRSLELLSVELSTKQLELVNGSTDCRPLDSAKVNFSKLRRLKLFGDTTFMPIVDADLIAMARTATNLEEFQITCMSTITIEGVMTIVKASQKTLRVLEHSPRSMSGFDHPHPGSMTDNNHLCELLNQCPRLEDLSISLPTMCATLFSNHNVKWRGECQVRALHLCGHEPHQAKRRRATPTSTSTSTALRKLLSAARDLTRSQAASILPVALSYELFFADCIFEPHIEAVHGEFENAAYSAEGVWPIAKTPSRKGPYGSTGLYGKDDDETMFECVPEKEFLRGLDAGYVSI